MKILPLVFFAALCACTMAQTLMAQTHNDPLTGREVDELRESAQDPKKRIDLLLSFAQERMLAVTRLRTATHPALNDPDDIADLLADLAALIDELDDNLEMYNGHSEDLRRPLHHVLDAEADLLKKLKALDENSTPLQKRRFGAALEDAVDSVQSSSESAQAMLADQIVKKGEEKSKEKSNRQENTKTPTTHDSDAQHE